MKSTSRFPDGARKDEVPGFIKVGKGKMCSSRTSVQRYVIHCENLKQWVNIGMKMIKAHRGIKLIKKSLIDDVSLGKEN